MVINGKFDFLSQRNYPKMALIKTAITKDFLILSAPGKSELQVPIQPTNDKIECRFSIFNILYTRGQFSQKELN
jgi:hypothetical protein